MHLCSVFSNKDVYKVNELSISQGQHVKMPVVAAIGPFYDLTYPTTHP